MRSGYAQYVFRLRLKIAELSTADNWGTFWLDWIVDMVETDVSKAQAGGKRKAH